MSNLSKRCAAGNPSPRIASDLLRTMSYESRCAPESATDTMDRSVNPNSRIGGQTGHYIMTIGPTNSRGERRDATSVRGAQDACTVPNPKRVGDGACTVQGLSSTPTPIPSPRRGRGSAGTLRLYGVHRRPCTVPNPKRVGDGACTVQGLSSTPHPYPLPT